MKRISGLYLFFLIVTLLLGCTTPNSTDDFAPTSNNPISRIPILDSLTVTETVQLSKKNRTGNSQWYLASANNETTPITYQSVSAILDIVRDGDYLWVATNGGLLHWHIETGDVTQYSAPQTPLPDNYVVSLILQDGLLYMSTKTAVVIFDRQDQWTIMTNEEIGAENSFGRPLALVEGTLWLGSSNGAFFLPPDGSWQAVDPEIFPYPEIKAIQQTGEGLYLETHNGKWGNDMALTAVLYTTTQEWETLPELESLIQIGPDGRWWQTATTELENNRRQYHLLVSDNQGESWRNIYQPEDAVSIKSFDDEGNVYLAQRHVTVKVSADEQVDIYDYQDIGPELNFINLIETEENGRIWFATDGRGLTLFDGTSWSNWQPETQADMREDAIRGLAVANGKVYAGAAASAASGGLMVLDIESDTWQNYWPAHSGACPENEGGQPELGREWERDNKHACEFTSLLELSAGGATRIAVNQQDDTVYIATDLGTLDIIQDGEWTHLQIPSETSAQEGEFIVLNTGGLGSQDAAVTESGILYLTAGMGIFSFDGLDWEQIASRDQLGGAPNQIAFDSQGELWVSTEVGLAHVDSSGILTIYNETNAPFEAKPSAYGIAIDTQDNIWLVNRDRLYRFNGQAWQTYSPEQFGHYSWGTAIAIDHQGQLWIESNNGAMVLPMGLGK